MKYCAACKTDLSDEEFNRNASTKDGLAKTCRSCMKSYRRNHYIANRKRIITEVVNRRSFLKAELVDLLYDYLTNHPCVDCGNNDPRVLEFDHIDRTQKQFDISGMISAAYLWESILIEIEKCEVRCANCHRIKTHKQFGSYRSTW